MTEEKLPNYGGQALIEGVMMRGAKSVAIAMRAPDGEIVIHTEELKGADRTKIVKLPFIRGLYALGDALSLGMRALTMSANLQTDEDEKIEGPALYGTIVLSMAFAIGLFILVPGAIGDLVKNWLSLNAWWGNLLEGLLRLLILIGYIGAIGRMEDIERVFGYHGAEHKTINAFEAGAELEPEIVTNHSIEHPRCGTAFLLTVVLFSIVFFSLLGPLQFLPKMLLRIVMIFPIASLAYEYIRWTANHLDSPFVRAIIKPNLALQGMTTRPPSPDMLEVGIAAFNAMRAKELELAGQ
jgi:uncharacterized protein YqhQ